ncbi:MAG: rod shape-determining protein MreD [Oscillatoriales cyanobacterium SM2_1_8]|nr:rod shape-determining protein MreD [Oscillatoriales cyanobacterium SM2_1_8]
MEMGAGRGRWVLGTVATLSSLLVCLWLMPMRVPGTTLLGSGPHWLLVWLVAWSLNRPPLVAAIVGATVGLLQDGLGVPGHGWWPSHGVGLALAGGLTALLQKQRYVQEDFVSVSLIVFGMATVVETVYALQLSALGYPLTTVWSAHQRHVLVTAILTSLWAPVVHVPMLRLWRWLEQPV